MRKTLLQFGVVAGLILGTLSLVSAPAVLAQVIDLPSAEKYNLPAPPKGEGVQQAKSLVDVIAVNVRNILGAVAVLMIIISGFRMILAQGNEDAINEQKKSLALGIVGLTIVMLSMEAEKIFSLERGGFLKDPREIVRRSTLFTQQTQIVVTFIKYLIGSVAVLMLVRSGMRLLSLGGQEDKVTQEKKNLVGGVFGLILIIFSDTLINRVFFKLDPKIYPGGTGADPKIALGRGVEELVGITNFIINLVGPLLILMFVAGGIMYITSRGEEEQVEKAKKILTSAAIGLVIVYGAFAITTTLLTGQFS